MNTTLAILFNISFVDESLGVTQDIMIFKPKAFAFAVDLFLLRFAMARHVYDARVPLPIDIDSHQGTKSNINNSRKMSSYRKDKLDTIDAGTAIRLAHNEDGRMSTDNMIIKDGVSEHDNKVAFLTKPVRTYNSHLYFHFCFGISQIN